MATLTRQLNLTNSAMALMVRAATDTDLLALAESEGCNLSDLTDAELDAVINGTVCAEVLANVRRQASPV